MGTLIGLYSERASHHIVPDRCTPTTISLRLSWIGADAEPYLKSE